MFNLRGSLSSCLTVVAFLVLTILAARFYGDTNSKTDFENSSLYQKGQVVVNTVWSYAKVIAGVNIIKNVGVGNANLGENVKSAINNYSKNDIKTDTTSNTGLNSYDIGENRPLVDLTNTASNDLKDINLKEEISSIGSFINYQKTVEGAEIIITSKSGREYKLGLPFKFLAK